jgi:hypothetical protein
VCAFAVVAGLVLLSLAGASAARATSCASAVKVDGELLFGTGSVDASRLPARGAERQAVVPACNDAASDDPDTATTVVTLGAIPATVAVLEPARDGTLYVAAGALVASEAHPLHAAMYDAGERRAMQRARRCRRERRAVAGKVDHTDWDAAYLVRDGRVDTFAVDAETRLVGRPAYEPVRKGQLVSARVSRCGSRRVIDELRFTGPVPAPAERTDDGAIAWRTVLWIALGLGFLGAVIGGVWSGRRSAAARPPRT